MTRHAELLDSPAAGRALRRSSATPSGSSPTRSCATGARSAARSARPIRPRTWPPWRPPCGPTLVVRSATGTRAVPAREFHTGPYETAVGAGRDPHRDAGAGAARLGQRLREGRAPGRRLGDRRRRCLRDAGRRHGQRRAASGSPPWGPRTSAPPRPRTPCGARRPPRTTWPRPPAARRELQPVGRPAGPGRLQAPPGAGADAAGAAPVGGPGAGRGSLTMQVTMTVNGDRGDPRHRAPAAARALRARPPGADRHPLGVRHLQLRHLRAVDGRRARKELHRAGRHGRRARRSARSRTSTAAASSIRSSRASCSATACSAASARPGC